MAALINGFTVRQWSGIPVHITAGSSRIRDNQTLSITCQCLRAIIIEEVSMIYAELLATLEYAISKVVRVNDTYKKRADGSVRPFGGINVVMCADWWLLQPVGGTALRSDPTVISAGLAPNAMNMFWDGGADFIRHTWTLTQPMRCKDEWYIEFLRQCRFVCLTADMYAGLHGLPSFTPACSTCTCNNDVVRDLVLGKDRKTLMEAFAAASQNMMKVIAYTPCSTCKEERAAKNRVLKIKQRAPEEIHSEPFPSAPAVHSFNVPHHVAAYLRAREYAKQAQQELTCCYANDAPLHRDDRELP